MQILQCNANGNAPIGNANANGNGTVTVSVSTATGEWELDWREVKSMFRQADLNLIILLIALMISWFVDCDTNTQELVRL